MRTGWSGDGRDWTLRLRLDRGEVLDGVGQGGNGVRLVTDCCTIRLPEHVDEPHPDLLALAAVLILRPWLARQVRFDRAISQRFADVLAETARLDAGPVDESLSPRRIGDRVGVSYSSGVDSLALAELLGSEAPAVHLQRVPHPRVPNRATHIRADQLARLAGEARDRGREVHIARSDLEYLCQPWPQYPSWPAVAVAAVLLADRLDLAAVAFGSVLEVIYLGGGRAYRGGGLGEWGPLLAAVGLPLCRPTASLTEVGTWSVAQQSPLVELAQSCLLGAARKPCLACPKCVRKELLSAAFAGRQVGPEITQRLRGGDPAAKDLEGAPPLYMQNTTEYILARVSVRDAPVLADLAARTDVTVDSTSWNERYYPRALREHVPERWRAGIEGRLRRWVDPMSPADVTELESFDGARRLRV